jgi:hypothetical protein
VRVAQTPSLVRDGKWMLKTHDLATLVAETGLPLDAMQRSLLTRLTGFAVWAGRYPIPLKSEDMTPTMAPATRQLDMPPGTWFAVGDREGAGEIFGRLEAL